MSRNMKKNHKSFAYRCEADHEERIDSIKISKAKSKSLFTRGKNQMLDLLESGNADRNEIKEVKKSIDQALASIWQLYLKFAPILRIKARRKWKRKI